MTVQESTICGLIQSFPVLLILAQNYNKCLKTPFIYKPPSPTQSPEYYEALEALFHNLIGHGPSDDHHGYPGNNGYYGPQGNYGCQGNYYGKKWPQSYNHYTQPCYSYGNSYPGHGYPNPGYGYNGYGNHGSPTYGYKKINFYNISGGHGYKGNYAPSQVYNLNNKYKVVVRKNKMGPHRRRSQKLRGYYPNQREDRRYENPIGYQNFLGNPSRIRNRVMGLVHVRPERPDSNPSYVFPFNNRPSNNGYDQYGKSYENYQGNYQNYPQYGHNQNNFPSYANQPYYEMPVRFPSPYPEEPNNNQNRPVFVTDYNDQGNQEIPNEVPEPDTENNGSSGDTSEEFNNGVFLPPSSEKPLPPFTAPNSGFNPELPAINPLSPSDPQHLPPLNPVPQSESNVKFPPFDPEPAPEFPTFPLPMSDPKELPPLTPVPPSDSTPELPPFPLPTSESKDLPSLTPLPTSDSKPEFPSFPLPTSEPKELPPVAPVPPSDLKPELSPLKPVPEVPEFNSENTPEAKDLPTLTPIQPSEPKELPPITSAPPRESNTLPTLTPVPSSESRNNFNFGSAGLFHETCETVDGDVGSCISVFECEPYLSLLQQSKSNPALVQILRKAHCGFEGNNPKVCCPRPGIPTAPPPPPTTSTTTTTTPAAEPAGKSDAGDYVSVFPEPPECGLSNASLSRVVGGVPAKLGDFPWMALLGYKNRRTQETRWLCGGSLISSKHILTAAHCIHGHETDLHVVRLGELDLAREDEGATPLDVLIKTKIKHEDYSPNAYTNDIGILVLERTVQFTSLIKPICIPRDSELRARSFENYNPLIAGWGDTEFRGPAASHLQVLQLPVVSNDFCAQAYSAYKAQTIDGRVLCAGYKKGGRDACQGDSGGPLMQPIWNSQDYKTFFYQIGVVSYGKKCAEAGFPGVYTRVTQFVPWLEDKVLGSA